MQNNLSSIKETTDKLKDMKSSASEIDSVSKKGLRSVQKLFRESANSVNENVTYIVVGDSTRENTYNEMIAYYGSQFSKINVSVVNNAASGQSGQDWKNNADQTTLQQCIDACTGTDGSNTVVEFSHGINDYKDGATEADVKGWLLEGLNALLLAKPSVNLVLVTPVITGNSERNEVLGRIYDEMSSELKLPLIDGRIPTAGVQGNSDYYQDSTHPNKFGSRRIVDYILDKILPIELLSIVTIEPYDSGTTPPSTNLNPTIDPANGYYSTSLGTTAGNEEWRRLLPIAVEPNFQIRVVHQGDRNDIIYLDNLGNFIINDRPTVTNNERFSTVPANGWEVRINVSSDGANYDLLNDVVTVEYFDPSQGLYLTIEDIHSGLNIRNTINKFRDGILIDDYGKIGSSGQALTVDANNKMKWQ